jgi:heat shock protein HslJ
MSVRGRLVCVLAATFVMGCGGLRAQTATAARPLEGTQWKLTWLPGTTVEAVAPQQAAYIELDPASHRMRGSGGCNQLMGGYELEGDHLKFAGAARTMMACAHGMATEDALVKALDNVREWKVSGSTLRLLDGNGQAVARFVATPQ